MIRSCASLNRDRDFTGLMECAKYSQPMPRTNPESTRPPDIRSSMAISSATRSGLRRIPMALPSTMMGALVVGRVRAGAGGHEVGRRHEPVGRLMVLVDRDPVEAELARVLELVQVARVQRAA